MAAFPTSFTVSLLFPPPKRFREQEEERPWEQGCDHPCLELSNEIENTERNILIIFFLTVIYGRTSVDTRLINANLLCCFNGAHIQTAFDQIINYALNFWVTHCLLERVTSLVLQTKIKVPKMLLSLKKIEAIFTTSEWKMDVSVLIQFSVR